MNFTIRLAEKKDMQSVIDLITELAVFEKEPNAVEITEADLVRDGFSGKPMFQVFVAEQDNKIIGIAITMAFVLSVIRELYIKLD